LLPGPAVHEALAAIQVRVLARAGQRQPCLHSRRPRTCGSGRPSGTCQAKSLTVAGSAWPWDRCRRSCTSVERAARHFELCSSSRGWDRNRSGLPLDWQLGGATPPSPPVFQVAGMSFQAGQGEPRGRQVQRGRCTVLHRVSVNRR
jgi:hypothetical protein